jgi:hypothetical protein
MKSVDGILVRQATGTSGEMSQTTRKYGLVAAHVGMLCNKVRFLVGLAVSTSNQHILSLQIPYGMHLAGSRDVIGLRVSHWSFLKR